MNTSYFANYRGDLGVSIALRQPPGCNYPTFKPLCPTYKILNDYKRTGDERLYIYQYYTQVLTHLNPVTIYNHLEINTLLCWEKTGTFCHRQLVVYWLENNLDVKIYELKN